jgi:acetyl esterase
MNAETSVLQVTPVVDSATGLYLNSLNRQSSPALSAVPVETARAMAYIGQARFAAPTVEATVEDREISIGLMGRLLLRCVRPLEARGETPAVMYFHGGGWIVHDRESYNRILRRIATDAGVTAVFVEYTRAPEGRYPRAIEEAYAATSWVAEHGHEIGALPDRIAVMGDSAGGNMAAAVAMLAKRRGGPSLAGQVLLYPPTDSACDTDSYREFGNGYFLTAEDMEWCWDQYAPSDEDRADPLACPLRATLDELRGLPPALIITGECDVLRDEGEAYARKLMQAGVSVVAARYLGTIHSFTFLNALADTPAARAAMSQAAAFLRERFANFAA